MLKTLIDCYFICLALLLLITYENKRPILRLMLKILTSFIFVAIGSVGFKSHIPHLNYTYFLLTGLLFSALGDLLLGLSHHAPIKDNPLLLGGIVTFGCAHIAFIISFIILDQFALFAAMIFPLIIAGLFVLATTSSRFDLGKLRLPVILYSFIISTMLVTALNTGIPLIIIGASLFVISDIVLVFVSILKRKYPILSVCNLLIYYLGQLCLAFVLFI